MMGWIGDCMENVRMVFCLCYELIFIIDCLYFKENLCLSI